MTALGIADDRSRRNENDGVLAALAGFQAPFAVHAATGVPVFVADDVNQAADVVRRGHDHAAAVATVAAVRTAARHVSFAAETHAPVSAVAGFAIDSDTIGEHRQSGCVFSSRTKSEKARLLLEWKPDFAFRAETGFVVVSRSRALETSVRQMQRFCVE